MTENTNKGKKPSHIVYHVRDGAKDQSYWDRVGVAWAHDDGKGFNVQRHAVPLDGRITLRVNEPKPANWPLSPGRAETRADD